MAPSRETVPLKELEAHQGQVGHNIAQLGWFFPRRKTWSETEWLKMFAVEINKSSTPYYPSLFTQSVIYFCASQKYALLKVVFLLKESAL